MTENQETVLVNHATGRSVVRIKLTSEELAIWTSFFNSFVISKASESELNDLSTNASLFANDALKTYRNRRDKGMLVVINGENNND